MIVKTFKLIGGDPEYIYKQNKKVILKYIIRYRILIINKGFRKIIKKSLVYKKN